MASPQLENGYTRISNELLEAMAKMNLSKYEWRVLLAIIRETYGWKEKMRPISVTQIQKLTGLDRRNIGRTKIRLRLREIIKVNGLTIGINKDYSQWASSLQTIAGIVYRDTRSLSVSIKLQSNLLESNDFRCEYCFEIKKWNETEGHHIIPKSLGGKDCKENTIRCCFNCHNQIHSRMSSIVTTDDMKKYYRHFVSKVSSLQTTFLSSLLTSIKEKKERLKKEDIYILPKKGEFENVKLTEKEFKKLEEKFGVKETEGWIESLGQYLESKGKKFKSHYATILTWARKEEKENGNTAASERDARAFLSDMGEPEETN